MGSVACRIFPDQGLNPSPSYLQTDNYSLDHYGIPTFYTYPHFTDEYIEDQKC